MTEPYASHDASEIELQHQVVGHQVCGVLLNCWTLVARVCMCVCVCVLVCVCVCVCEIVHVRVWLLWVTTAPLSCMTWDYLSVCVCPV
jgi:hypothetical protein